NTGFSAATTDRISFSSNGAEKMAVNTSNVISLVPYCDQAIQVNTGLSTGGTATSNAGTSILILNPGNTVNNCTVTFPPNPTNGQYFTLLSGQGQAINNITNTGGTGSAVIVNPITALSPSSSITATTGGVSVSYVYYSAGNRWYRIGRG